MVTSSDEHARPETAEPLTSAEGLQAILERRFDSPRIRPASSDQDADVWVVIGSVRDDDVPNEGLRETLRAMERFAGDADPDFGLTPSGERVVRVAVPPHADQAMALRYAGQSAGRALRGLGGTRFGLVHSIGDPDQVAACLAAVRIGAYRSPFKRRNGNPKVLSRVGGAVPDAKLREAQTMSDAVIASRSMVETPANLLTPTAFSDIAAVWASNSGLRCEVVEADDLVGRGFVATAAIGASSDHSPRALVMRNYEDDEPPDIALVGKGVTFDSGGISLKPANNMGKLKGDMAGAAAVTCAALAAVSLGRVNRFAIVVPLAENLPDGAALRPGDVLTFADGTRVHVDNTDAEGRMLLADGVCFARSQLGAERIVTVGTLTKACIVALGNWYAALYANSDELAETILESGQRNGERAWRMPLGEEYRHSLRSPVAALSNSSNDGGGSILAATFIGSFAGSAAWAHIDMSSIFFMDRELPWADAGYTGAGARLLAGLLSAVKPDGSSGRT